MNARKMVSAMSCFVFFMFAFLGDAFAENDGDWCTGVKILGAGANTNSKMILLIHTRTDCGAEWPPNTQRWFSLDDSGSNASAMLAAALTAQATGKTLIVVGKNGLFTDWNALTHVSTSSN